MYTNYNDGKSYVEMSFNIHYNLFIFYILVFHFVLAVIIKTTLASTSVCKVTFQRKREKLASYIGFLCGFYITFVSVIGLQETPPWIRIFTNQSVNRSERILPKAGGRYVPAC